MSRILILLSVTFTFLTSSNPVWAMCSTNKCKAAGDAAAKGLADGLSSTAIATPDQLREGALGGMLVTGQCAADFAAAAKLCEEEKKKECVGRCDSQGCKDKFDEIAAGFTSQAGSCTNNSNDFNNTQEAANGGAPPPGGGGPAGSTPPPPGEQKGGGASLMPLLMGAGMGAIAGMMLGKDDKDKDKKKDEERPESETPRDAADCTIAAGANDSRCNAELESKCAMTPELEICSLFVARYCAEKPATSPPDTGTTPNMGTGTDNVTTASTDGEGSGKPFCLAEKTKKFCQENGRASCLSCIELSRPKPGNCHTDPGSCAPQYSQAEIDSAKVACPVDPKFADPAFAASASGSGGPAVMLPSSIGRSPASDIAPRYGKSVFSISSVTMKKMCDENRLNNCPKN